MRRGEVFFHPMEGSGQLGISWSSALKGAAIEAKKGNGVGFFSTNGDLLSVIFLRFPKKIYSLLLLDITTF